MDHVNRNDLTDDYDDSSCKYDEDYDDSYADYDDYNDLDSRSSSHYNESYDDYREEAGWTGDEDDYPGKDWE